MRILGKSKKETSLLTMLRTGRITVEHIKKLGKVAGREVAGEFLPKCKRSSLLWRSFNIVLIILDHTIDEIRLRALDNIIYKHEFGFVYDCDAVKTAVIQKLFNWFSFESAPQPERVLNFLLRLAQVCDYFLVTQ